MTGQKRPTFRQILNESAVESATALWTRAVTASRLRHSFVSEGRYRGARLLADLKARCLEQAVEILPAQILVTIDRDYQVGLVSVRWPGHGRLHLPCGSLMKRPA